MKKVEYSEIKEGQEIQHRYKVTEKTYQSFLECFEDHNPLHMQDDYAVKNGFKSKVMHGGILNGFLSHFVGEVFPGEKSLLLSTQIDFLKPVYMNQELELQARVAQTVDNVQVVVVDFKFVNLKENYAVARGQIKVRLRT